MPLPRGLWILSIIWIAVFGVLFGLNANSALASVVPYGWPEGFSGLQKLGTITRFAPYMRTDLCRESDSLHVAWLADYEDGESNAVMYRTVDLAGGQPGSDTLIVFELAGDGRIHDFDFALTEVGVQLAWVTSTGGEVHLMTGSFGLSQYGVEERWVRTVLSTDRSISDPRVAVVGEEVYLAWADSHTGVLNVGLGVLDPAGGDVREIEVSSTPQGSTVPELFEHREQTYLAWVERVGEITRELRIAPVSGGTVGLEVGGLVYATKAREVFPSLVAHADRTDVLIAVRDAGRDHLYHLDLGAWLDAGGGEAAVAEEGQLLLSAANVADASLVQHVTERADLEASYTLVDRGNRMSVFTGTLTRGDLFAAEEMTPTVQGAYRPSAIVDEAGQRHLLFLKVQADLSVSVQYMNTVNPATVSYWNVVGLDVERPLASIPGRALTVLALAAAMFPPNLLPVLIAGGLLFAAGAWIRIEGAWFPGLVLAVFTVVWRSLLREPFLYYGGHTVLLKDTLAAVGLSFVGAWLLVRRRQWRGEPLAVVALVGLWFLWYFALTLIRI